MLFIALLEYVIHLLVQILNYHIVAFILRQPALQSLSSVLWCFSCLLDPIQPVADSVYMCVYTNTCDVTPSTFRGQMSHLKYIK